jgi:hypothetical protein
MALTVFSGTGCKTLQLSTQYNRISKHTHLKVRFLSMEGESTLDEEVLSIEA